MTAHNVIAVQKSISVRRKPVSKNLNGGNTRLIAISQHETSNGESTPNSTQDQSSIDQTQPQPQSIMSGSTDIVPSIVNRSLSSVRRKPVSPQNANFTPSLTESPTTIVSFAAQQVEPTSSTPEDRTIEPTRESPVEVSGAILNYNLSKHPSPPSLSEESPAPMPSPQIAKTDREILERAQTAPAQLASVQTFIPSDIDDKKRRRKKAIRNGVILYITFLS